MTNKILSAAVAAALLLPAAAHSDTVVLSPIRDTTLYEDPGGLLGNGSGENLFVGRTLIGELRRAVVAFDVAAAIPAGSTIDGVQLSLHMDQTAGGAATVNLYQLSAAWGEGSSDAPGPEGGGTAAEAGDATWIHRFFDTATWTAAGGDFGSVLRAASSVAGPGPYTWGSSPEMVDDVQAWLNNPSSNFGWVLVGDESTVQTAKRFGSRENLDPAAVPSLLVDFTPLVPAESRIPTMTNWGILTMVALLIVVATRRLSISY